MEEMCDKDILLSVRLYAPPGTRYVLGQARETGTIKEKFLATDSDL